MGSSYRLCGPFHVVGFVTLWASVVAGQEPVSVSLASGREFSGLVDQHTTADQFWLKSSQAGAAVVRPIAWERIDEARIDERVVDIAEFQRVCAVDGGTTPREPTRANAIRR